MPARFDREFKLALSIALAFLLIRSVLATQSAFTFHQGWNEGHYALVAWGFFENMLVPQYGDHYVYNVPPLFPYLVFTSFNLFGQSEVAARLPSILATSGGIVAVYVLGNSIYDDRRISLFGAGIFAVLPYVQLYGGRAQTDALMVALATASLGCIVRGYRSDSIERRWLVYGGVLFAAAFAAKQPAILLPAIVLGWLVLRGDFSRDVIHRTAILIGTAAIALVPIVLWLYLNYLQAPAPFVATWEHELLHRTAPFSNILLVVVIGLVLGHTPLVLLLAADMARKRNAYPTVDELPLFLWLALFGAFVLYRTPHGHQYYALVLAPPLALLAAARISAIPGTRWIRDYEARHVVLVLVISSCIIGTGVLFEMSGEYSIAARGGEQIAPEASQYLEREVSVHDRVIVSSGYRPVIQWYTRDSIDPTHISSYRAEQLSTELLEESATSNGTLYVVVPTPYWAGAVPTSLEPVYTTTSYEFTTTTLVPTSAVRGSKFSFYVNDRRLTIYRYVPNQTATNKQSEYVSQRTVRRNLRLQGY